MKCRALESNAQDKFNAAGAGRLLRPRYGLVPALPVNGWQASASGTGSDGNRVTPRTSAFRESIRGRGGHAGVVKMGEDSGVAL
jgi:hypothetical protein